MRALRGLGRSLRRGGSVGHARHRSAARISTATGLLAAVLAPAAFVGTGAAQAAETEEKVTFTVAFLNEADSFNPFLGIEAESFEMWGLMYDYMTGYTMEDMQPAPALGTEWETSEDGLTWTYTIRDDAMWSDGEQLTAEDVAFTYNRILDGGPEAATWGSYLNGVTEVSAIDDTTVELTLKKPSAVLPLLPIPIVPEHVWADISEKDIKSYSNEPQGGQPVVGSGPFRLLEGTAGGSTYRFEANPDYWGGAPNIDEVVFRVFKSDDPAIQALIKGEVDFVEGISAVQVDALQGRDGITAQNGDSPGFDEIAFNTGSIDTETGDPIGDPNPAVLDPKFRFALNYVLDREQIIEKAYQGAGQPGSTIIPPAYKTYHWEAPEEDVFTFDLEKAGQLLDDAGYTMGDDGLRTMPDGSPIGTLRLFARSDSKTSIDVMEFFQEWLGQVGIESEVIARESGKLTDIILEGTFDAFEWGWYVEPDPDSMLSYMTCGQLGNWSDSWYCDEEYDALYDQQHVEQDDAARAEQIKQMQEILYYDAPYLVTAYSSIGEAWRSDRFTGFQPQPDPGGVMLVQYGVHNYLNIEPVTDEEGSEDQNVGTGLVIGGGVALAVLAAAGVVVAMRRRSTAGDRE